MKKRTQKLWIFFSFLFSLTAHSQEVPILSPADTSFADVYRIMDDFYSSQEDGSESTSEEEEEGGTENEFYRWANFWKPRLANSENIFKNGDLASALMAKAIYANEQPCEEITDDDAINWEKLGPSNSLAGNRNNQGRVNAVSVHPDDDTEIVIGAHQGGIWRTTDGGQNWSNTTDVNGLSVVGVNQIVRHPANPNYMYAATGNAEALGFLNNFGRAYGMGVLFSDDGGSTWEKTFDLGLGDGRNGHITDIAITPSSTETETVIYVGSAHKIRKYSGDYQPSFNADIDLEWDIIHSDGTYYNDDITQGVNGTNTVGNIEVESDGTVWFTDRFNLYKVEPNATEADSMVLTIPCTEDRWRRTDFEVTINNNDELAVLATYYYDNEVCGSTINQSICSPGNLHGSSVSVYYNKRAIEENTTPRFYIADVKSSADQGDMCLSLENDDIIYIDRKPASSRFPNKCTGFGSISSNEFECLTCTVGDVSSMHVDQRDLICYSSVAGDATNDVIYAGHDGGISKSSDSGATWEDLNGEGLLLTNNLGLAITPQDRNYILTGAQDNSINLFTDAGWIYAATFGGDNAGCAINPKNKSTIYQSTQNSIQGGGNSASRFFPVLLNPNKFDEICWGNRGHINTRIIGTSQRDSLFYPLPYTNVEANSITMSLDNNLLFAAVGYKENGAILKFERTSTGWTEGVDISGGIKANEFYGGSNGQTGLRGPIIDIEVDPDNPLRLWATIGGFNPYYWFQARDQGNKVFQTQDGGATWTNISHCLPNVPVLSVVYQRGTNDRLYIGTDLGVFVKKDANTEAWSYYAEGGPGLMVHNMEINHCSNELVVATQGQGLWRVPLLEAIEDAPPRKITGSNVIWKNEKSLISDLIIKSGAKLTIKNGRLSMKSGTKIFVEKGGKLHLDNGTITNYCGDRWEGIVVEGDANKFQYVAYQGSVNLNHGSIIENAETAVTLFNPDAGTNTNIAATTGGMIWAKDSEFRNNLKDVCFRAYVNDCPFNPGICDNTGYFNNCTFTTNEDFIDPYAGTSPGPNFTYRISHILQSGVKGVSIRNCTFQDERANPGISRVYGIISIDSSPKIYGDCNPTGDTNCENEGLTRFSNLYRGVEAFNLASNKNIKVFNCEFTGNKLGVITAGINNSEIYRNAIEVGSTIYNEPFTGIFIYGGEGFLVTENNITKTDWLLPAERCAGILVKETRETSNKIYGNHIRNMHAGLLSNGDNRGNTALFNFTGLRYACNDIKSYVYDMVIPEEFENGANRIDLGIGKVQGVGSNVLAPNASGNLFDDFPTNAQSHFYNENDNSLSGFFVNEVDYWFFNEASRQEPTEVSAPTIGFAINNNVSEVLNLCPSEFDDDDNDDRKKKRKRKYVRYAKSLDSLKNIYRQNLDNGYSDLAHTVEITPESSSGNLKQKLLQASPWLSNEVLRAVANKTGDWTNESIVNILVSNPEVVKHDGYLNFVANLSNPLTTTELEEVQNTATANSTARAEIEQSIALADAEKQEAVNWFIRYYMEHDSIYPIDSVRYWLNNGETFTQRMQIVNTYVEEENYGQAGIEIQTVLSDFTLSEKQERELNQNLELLYLWKEEGNLNYFDLDGFVSSYQTDLISLTDNKKLIPGQRVAALLHYIKGEDAYEPEAIFPAISSTFNFQIPTDESLKDDNTTAVNLKISPNPTSGSTTIQYDIPENMACQVLRVTDFTGKVLIEETIKTKQGTILFRSSNFPRGVLLCQLLCDGEVVFSKKIISIK